MENFLEYINKKNRKNVVLIVGSARSKDCCPGEESKTHKIAEFLEEKFKEKVNFEVIDLSVKCDGVNVQPCKGCTSTSSFHCHWPCIEATQRVHLLNGFKEIKDIKVGDTLQDGNKVTKHILTAKDNRIYQIKLEDGRCLKLTQNHKVKVLSKKRYRDKSSNFLFYRKEEWKELKEIRIGDNIPKIETDDNFLKNKSKKDYLYTIFGLLWGDGTLCGNSAILYVDSNKVEFIKSIQSSFGKEIVSTLEHKISNGKIRETQKSSTKMIKINFGTKIGKEFKNLFCKNKATERRLNLKAFKNKNQIFNFLNGWISTDGSIKKSKNSIFIYNTSYELLRDLQLLLSRISVESYISDLRHKNTEIRGKAYQRCSSLSISDQSSIEIIIKNIKLLDGKKDDNLKQNNKKRKIKRTFSKVKSIEYVGLSDVYDIEVENSHFFNCEGIKVHNCSCYSKKSDPKDLMYEQNVYNKLEKCDGFFLLTPINWSSCSSVVKSFFDRLVCASLTMTSEDAIKILGEEDIKNSKKTRSLEQSGKHNDLLKNRLEGKHAGFFAHGNQGGADYKEYSKNKTKLLPVIPESLMEYEKTHGKEDVNKLLDPLVRQCVYMGIRVPDDCVKIETYGFGVSYSEINDKFSKENILKEESKKIFENFLNHL